MKRQVPKMTTDEEAEALLESDLSDLDFGQFKSTRFGFAGDPAKSKRRTRKVGGAQSVAGSAGALDPIHSKGHK